MTPFDDPLTKLAREADALLDALAAADPAAPGPVIEAARALRGSIGKVSAAMGGARADQLRAALDRVERRREEETRDQEHTRARERIQLLEREVEVLLSPARREAKPFYEGRVADLEAACGSLESKRKQQLRGAQAAETEMERARLAALATATHEAEETLKRELAIAKRRLDAVQSG